MDALRRCSANSTVKQPTCNTIIIGAIRHQREDDYD